MSGFSMEAHPAAESFPLLSWEELNQLAADIAANGLLEPIVLTPAGDLLDGRNRLAACTLLDHEPTFVTYEGDPWAYSRSRNLWRRNLTTGQRAASCALSLIAEGKRKDGRWARGSVPSDEGDSTESRNTWQAAMTQAGFVADWSDDDDLITLVRDGKAALDAAYRTAKARSKAANDADAIRALLTEKAPDLALLVTEERMSLADAHAAHLERERKEAERRRDARHLIDRALNMLAAGERESGPEFLDEWLRKLVPLDPDDDLPERLDDAIRITTYMAKGIRQ